MSSFDHVNNREETSLASRPRQGRVKLPFYLGNGVDVESKGKDITMG